MISVVALLLAACKSVLAAVITFGWAASLGWRRVLDQATVSKLSYMAKTMFLPCIIFDSVAGGLSMPFLRENWSLAVIGLLVLVVGFVVGHCLASQLALPDSLRPWFVLAVAVPNMVALPLVLVEAICHEQEGTVEGIVRCVDGCTTRLFTVTLFHTFLIWTVGPPYIRSFARRGVSLGAPAAPLPKAAQRRPLGRGSGAERAGLKDGKEEDEEADAAREEEPRAASGGEEQPKLAAAEGAAGPAPEVLGRNAPAGLRLPVEEAEDEGQESASPSKTRRQPGGGCMSKDGLCRQSWDWLMDNPPVVSNLLALMVAASPRLHGLFYGHAAPLSFLASATSLLGKASPGVTNAIAGVCFGLQLLQLNREDPLGLRSLGISRTAMAMLVVGRIVVTPALNLLCLLLFMPLVPRDPLSRLILCFQHAGTTANVITLMAQVTDSPEGAQLVALATIPQMLLYIPVSVGLIALGMAWNESLGT